MASFARVEVMQMASSDEGTAVVSSGRSRMRAAVHAVSPSIATRRAPRSRLPVEASKKWRSCA